MSTHLTYLVRLAGLIVAISVSAVASVRADEPVFRPDTPRVLHIPTAHLQPPAVIYATLGGTHRGGVMAGLSTGLGQLAEIDAELSDHLAVCDGCATPGEKIAPDSLLTGSAQFKVGLAERRFSRWQPALALGYRKSFLTRKSLVTGEVDSFDDYQVARLFVAVSKGLGPFRLHGGVDLWDAEVAAGDQRRALSEEELGQRVRPFVGLAWTPSIYPRTSLVGDFSWIPVPESGQVTLNWLAGWGVQYQAVDRVSIELAVRHRQGEDLGDSTVLFRINAITSRSQR